MFLIENDHTIFDVGDDRFQFVAFRFGNLGTFFEGRSGKLDFAADPVTEVPGAGQTSIERHPRYRRCEEADKDIRSSPLSKRL